MIPYTIYKNQPVVAEDAQIISTSDRISFKRCRRKWILGSNLANNLEPLGASAYPLWFGSGYHFALEDYHGHNLFGHPYKAFEAYVKAFKEHELPNDWEYGLELAEGMFNYYVEWYKRRNDVKTLWYRPDPLKAAIPAVEVNVFLHMGDVSDTFKNSNAYYRGTFDRIVEDLHGRYWIVDYKTARSIDTSKLEMDPQITTYLYLAEMCLNIPIEGMMYMQHRKDLPADPKVLKNGTLSVAKNQLTTYIRYRKTIDNLNLNIDDYKDMLERLMEAEDEDGDKFVRRSWVRRNKTFRLREGEKIAAEAYDMLSPNSVAVYPNPTRDCSWDCNFVAPCLAMDDGYDWQGILEEGYEERPDKQSYDHSWRGRIVMPERKKG